MGRVARPKALLLDAFGTLVRMEPPAPHLRRELAAHGIAVSAARAERAFAAEIAYYLENHVAGRDERSLDDLRERCAAVLRDALGEPALDLATARRAMLAAIRFDAYPDAAPALRAVRAGGIRVVVASNWDCSLPGVLARTGLAALLDRVVTSAEVGAAKPSARFFEAALDAAGCGPEQAVYVGDSPHNDVAAAQAVGMRALLVRRGASEPPALARLTELPPLILLAG